MYNQGLKNPLYSTNYIMQHKDNKLQTMIDSLTEKQRELFYAKINNYRNITKANTIPFKKLSKWYTMIKTNQVYKLF